jgi:hypothetical protein
MATKLIKLTDDTLVEVEVSEDHAQEISGGMAKRVEASFDAIKDVLTSLCRPLSETWKELGKEMQVDSAEVQFGLSFESEGNIFVASAKTGGNLTVKLTMKPKR